MYSSRADVATNELRASIKDDSRQSPSPTIHCEREILQLRIKSQSRKTFSFARFASHLAIKIHSADILMMPPQLIFLPRQEEKRKKETEK